MSEERKKERCKRKDIALKVVNGFLEKDCEYGTELYYSLETVLDYIDKLQEENDKLKYEQLEVDELIKENKYLKQRNKVIEIITNDLPSDTEFVIMTRKGFENNPTCDYISRVKIRDKIKELKIKRGKSGSSIYGYGIYFLEELLDKE